MVAVPLIVVGLAWDASESCSYPNVTDPSTRRRLMLDGVPMQCTTDLSWLTTTMLIVGIIVAVSAVALAFRSGE
jgi:hypothetical protein